MISVRQCTTRFLALFAFGPSSVLEDVDAWAPEEIAAPPGPGEELTPPPGEALVPKDVAGPPEPDEELTPAPGGDVELTPAPP